MDGYGPPLHGMWNRFFIVSINSGSMLSTAPLKGGKSKINSPKLALVPNFSKSCTESPQKIQKSGNEGFSRKCVFRIFTLWPKCRFSGQKCCFLALNPFFSEIVQIFWHHHDWTPKRLHFCVDLDARRASGAHFWPENLHYFMLRLYNPRFFRSDGPDSMGSYVPHVLR